MAKHGIASLLAILLIVGGTTAGAEKSEGGLLPDRLEGRISIKSVDDLVAGLDNFAAAATAGSEKMAVPKGMIIFLAGVYLQFFKDAFYQDDEIHILIPSFQSLLSKQDFRGIILLFRGNALGDVSRAAESSGAEIRQSGQDWIELAIPNEIPLFVWDIGDGQFAFGSDKEEMARALYLDRGGPMLPPSHPHDCLLRMVVSPKATGTAPGEISRFLRDAVKQRMPEITRQLDPKTLGHLPESFREMIRWSSIPEVVGSLLSVGADKFADAIDTLEREKSFRLDLQLEKKHLALSFGIETAGDTFIGGMANSLAAMKQPENALADRIGRDAAMFSIYAPPAAFLPDFQERYATLVDNLLGSAFPETRGDLGIYNDATIGLVAGGGVSALYFEDDIPLSVFLGRPAAPEALVDSFAKLPELLNRMLDKLIDTSIAGFGFTGEAFPALSGNLLRLSFSPDSVLAELAASELHRTEEDIRSEMENCSTFLARQGDTIVLLGGAVTSGNVLRKSAWDLAAGTAKAENPFLAAPEARNTLRTLGYRQGGFTLLNLQGIAGAASAAFIKELGDIDPELRDMDFSAFDFSGKGDMAGFSFGADDHGLVWEMVLPADSVNSLLRGFEKGLSAIGKKRSGDDGAIGEEEPEEEEEYYFDEEWEDGDEEWDALEDGRDDGE
ncbi:MAG: hypothetical protein LBE84_05430 [Planctomycetota bacterium]|nr:hypothetical protein [Planctomycetota bacterium]